jgi:hypothetical protein
MRRVLEAAARLSVMALIAAFLLPTFCPAQTDSILKQAAPVPVSSGCHHDSEPAAPAVPDSGKKCCSVDSPLEARLVPSFSSPAMVALSPGMVSVETDRPLLRQAILPTCSFDSACQPLPLRI